MPQTDKWLLYPKDIAAAIGLLTRLPVPLDSTWATRRGAAAAWAWPLAGLLVAALAALVAAVLLALGLPAPLAAGVALALQMLLTGAMHEDGLADAADGLWGGWEPARRLEIMQDSRIGTYGVLALLLVTGLRWQAIAALFTLGHVAGPMLAAAVLSRAPMAVLTAWLPNARQAGLAHSVGRPTAQTALYGTALAFGIAAILLGVSALWVAIAVVLTSLAMAALAQVKIGGQTGDILGATQQLGETAALAVMLTLA